MRIIFTLLISLQVIYSSCSNNKIQRNKQSDCISSDIEKIDHCLVGMKIQDAIQKIDFDNSKVIVVDEPPGILRGISISLNDTCRIRLYVSRISILDSTGADINIKRKTLSEIVDKKIIGIAWRKYKDRKEIKRNSIGEVIWQWGD